MRQSAKCKIKSKLYIPALVPKILDLDRKKKKYNKKSSHQIWLPGTSSCYDFENIINNCPVNYHLVLLTLCIQRNIEELLTD